MFRSILVCFVLALGSGCVRAPIPITSVVHTEPAPVISRQDLPTNWFEVKLSNISYGLPKDFVRLTKSLPSEVLSRYHSSVQNLTIDCYARNSTTDLHEYVLDNFILPRSGKIIAVREKAGLKPVVVVQSIDGTTSSLDFFVQSNDTIYQLTCFSDTVSLKNNSATCFKVIDTIHFQ